MPSARSSVRSKAEEKFAQAQRREKKAMEERRKREQAADEKMARLRALRLSKEAADKKLALAAAAEKAASKRKTPVKRAKTAK